MTIAELNRAYESYVRNQKRKAQEKASYNYILAALIGKSVASYFAEEITYPELAEAYPTLFDSENQQKQEQKRKAKEELSAIRFKQFAKSYNDRFIKKGVQSLSE